MKRSYLNRRPDEDNYDGNEVVRAKPLNERYAKNLGSSYRGKDFVKAGVNSQKQFYGKQTVLDNSEPSGSGLRPLTHDERNKLSAKIIKAELKQDKELVEKLKKRLENGMIDESDGPTTSKNSNAPEEDESVLLLTQDKRTGLVMPARSDKSLQGDDDSKNFKSIVEKEYHREMGLSEMLANEKSTSALDQLTMFDRAAKMCSDNKVDDDWNLDDNIISHPKKRRHDERDAQKNHSRRIEEHKALERTLDSCRLCMGSRHLQKHAIVAVGLKTYLAVVTWAGLSDEHCYIAPMEHCASSVLLDEDVYEEVQLWRKGLVAMWKGVRENADDFEEEDCVFVENAKNVNQQSHMTIECIPLPKESGDLAPSYFKKAIMECEKEWSDNLKLIDLSKKSGVRKAIPKGFPYFSVNFGLQEGYAHVIENADLFPSNFAQEIIGGMLDLPHTTWRNVRQLSFDEVKQKRDRLQAKWKKYDWTETVKAAIKERRE